jgi:metallophosphoesterase superfamily enzyme
LDSFTIVHLSDVHLGNDFFWRSTYRRRWYRNTEDPQLLKGLENALRKIKPVYVVLSGDVVNKCRKANFRHAAERLRKLFTDAGINVKEQVMVIPGNHDVRLFPKSDESLSASKGISLFPAGFLFRRQCQGAQVPFQDCGPRSQASVLLLRFDSEKA